MQTFLIILFLIIILGFLYIKKNNLHIDFKSFFKIGFQKIDNAFGISCYCGKQGTGKTYSAIKFIEEQKEHFGYTVISNVKSYINIAGGVDLEFYKELKKNEGKNHSCSLDYVYEPDIFKIIEYCSTFKENDENILIFFDEIFSVLEKGGALKRDILAFLSQLRKRKILFVTTAQEWAEINITFRRYVRYQISCSMRTFPFTHKAFLVNSINDGDQIHWDEQQQDYIAPIIQLNISKGLKEIIDKYDTFETINNTQILNKSKF